MPINKPDQSLPEVPKPGQPDNTLPKPDYPAKPDHELPGKPEKPDWKPPVLPGNKPDHELPRPEVPQPKKDELKEKAAERANDREKNEILARIKAILEEYGNLESNVPVAHEYWTLLNRYRSLM